MKAESRPNYILVKFGDNDFRYTMMAFGRLFVERDYARDPGWAEGWLTEAKIAELWNMLTPGLYLLCQNEGRYRNTSEDFEHTRKYLQITPDRVYLNEAAREYVTNHQWGWNGEWLFIDLVHKTVVCV